jgi:hypothetical protein
MKTIEQVGGGGAAGNGGQQSRAKGIFGENRLHCVYMERRAVCARQCLQPGSIVTTVNLQVLAAAAACSVTLLRSPPTYKSTRTPFVDGTPLQCCCR